MSIPSFKIIKDVNATKIQDVQVTTKKPTIVNDTIVFDGFVYDPSPGSGGSVILGGDVTGPSGTNVLDKIKGITVNAAVPASGDTLIYDGPVPGEWAPGLGGAVVLGGDVTGPSGTNTLDKLRGVTLSTNVPASGEVLVYDTVVAGEWAPGPVPISGIFDPANPVFYGTGTSTNNSGLGSVTIGPGAVTTGGLFSVAIGTNAYAGGTSGISLGNLALSAGDSCIMIGVNSGTSLMTGAENIGIGNNATAVLTTGTANIGFGPRSLVSVTAGDSNVGIGKNSVSDNALGSNNTGVGVESLARAQNSDNTAIGYSAGFDLVTGTNCSFLGFNAQPSAAGVNNEITLGDNNVTVVRSFGAYTFLSDARDKKNIEPMKAGIDFVNELKPVHFEWNMRDGSRVDMPDSGFIAQDLKEVQNTTGITIPGLVYESNPERLEISTQKLIPILVKAIQDLSKEIQELKAARNM